ncbi:hypothetical protein ALC57_18892 [Trachymyrmex cornetzi]|uniref:Uncharacterized protein n=1 Tax=Trachymyrmex cornetzi TaxID=471704 RepID=A0A195D7S5_9HYME|nr:hypothetical protein ALC57_18892 [Trachymyrmex cornetzi]
MPIGIINLNTEGRLSPTLFHPTNPEKYELSTHTYTANCMNRIGKTRVVNRPASLVDLFFFYYRTVKPIRSRAFHFATEGNALWSIRDRWKSGFRRQRPYGKKSSRIAPHVDTMYVMETGGHKVAPVPTSTRVKKVVDYNKTMNQHHHHRHHESGGGGERGGGGTHIAATVKNTVRRLLRRTKSHRDTPSTNASTMTSAVTNGHPIVPPSTRISRNYDVPPPSTNFKRYSRARVRLQSGFQVSRNLELIANFTMLMIVIMLLLKMYSTTITTKNYVKLLIAMTIDVTSIHKGIGKAWKDFETGAFLKKTTHKLFTSTDNCLVGDAMTVSNAELLLSLRPRLQ